MQFGNYFVMAPDLGLCPYSDMRLQQFSKNCFNDFKLFLWMFFFLLALFFWRMKQDEGLRSLIVETRLI